MMLLSLDQLFLCTLNIILTLCHVCFNAVDFFALRKDQGWKLVEQLNALIHGGLQFLNVSKLILNVTDCVFQSDTCLTVNFLLKHLLSQLRIIHVFLQLLIIDIPIYQSHLPRHLVLDSCLKLLFKILLPLQHVLHLLAQIQIEVLFHSSLRLVLSDAICTGCDCSDFLTY